MSDHPAAAGPPAWIDPLPDPETIDHDGGDEIGSGDDSAGATAEALHPCRRPAP